MNTFSLIRKRLGLTQVSLGEKIGVSQGNVAHYERGQTVPPAVAKKLIEVASEMGHALTFNDIYDFKTGKKHRRSTDKNQ